MGLIAVSYEVNIKRDYWIDNEFEIIEAFKFKFKICFHIMFI